MSEIKLFYRNHKKICTMALVEEQICKPIVENLIKNSDDKFGYVFFFLYVCRNEFLLNK
jgi:hypothetical protein